MLTPATEQKSQRVWPEIIAVFLGLATFGYTMLAQPNPWFIALAVMFVAITLILLLRDSGAFTWCRKKLLSMKANRVAKIEYPRFVKMFERARVHQDLVRELRNLGWKVNPIPQFASMSFENWYSDIHGKVSRLRVRRASELELLGDRFHDFLTVLNTDYLRPFSEALRQGHAKYQNEQAEKNTRVAKESYDRFLETYKVFCEEINDAASRRILVAVHSTPPVFDWNAAAPEQTKGFTTDTEHKL